MQQDNNDLPKLNLWQKLAAIAEEAGTIEKTGKNQHFNYNFIEHSNIMGHYRPILARYGVVIDLEALDAEFIQSDKTTKVKINMRYYVTNADKPEETFSRLWVTEANDNQDKAINKALTAAEKNVFMKLFHISDVDPDADEAEQPKQQRQPRTATQSQQRPQQPARPAQPTSNYTYPPKQATAPTGGPDKATEQQIQAIKKIAARAEMSPAELTAQLQELYGKALDALDKSEASHFIKVLQGGK